MISYDNRSRNLSLDICASGESGEREVLYIHSVICKWVNYIVVQCCSVNSSIFCSKLREWQW